METKVLTTTHSLPADTSAHAEASAEKGGVRICLARQPILDREESLYGYELLFRSEREGGGIPDGNIATARVLTHAFVDIGVEEVVGEHRAFVNMPGDFLTGKSSVPLNPAQVVIEVLETVAPTPDVIAGIEKLKGDGYTIALDDFEYRSELQPFIALADLVKLDISGRNEAELADQVAMLRGLGINTLLAERVETQEEYQFCRDLGFDYFQGYFFAQPQIVEGQQIPGNDLTLLRLMSKVWQPEFDLGEIEELIAQDVSLSYKLLRFINSAAFVTRREIDTIHGAVVILGIRNLARWISMLTVGSLESSGNALTELALIRGRTCELIALSREQKRDAPIYFTAGLLSILDALTGMPMQDALELLPLSPELNDALRERKGPIGQTLANVIDYEQQATIENPTVDLSTLTDAYLQAITWTRQMQESLTAI